MQYSIKVYSILYIVFSFFISCKNKSTRSNKVERSEIELKSSTVSKKYVQPRDRLYITDTITTANAVKFFTKYGDVHKETKINIQTRLGDITVLLYKNTPIHRASFIYLIKKGYFDTTCFYRVVPNFIVQGGSSDNLVTPAYKEQLNDYRIPSEFRKNRTHKRGCIAAARDWKNNPTKESTPFEFYFIQAKREQSHLNFEHTVFGEIIRGMDVIDKITTVEIDRYEWPEKEIPMKITLLE